MTAGAWRWSAAATFACVVIFGSVYWTRPYDDLDIASITLPLYVLACVPVIALRSTATAPFVIASLTLPSGLVLAVGLRIVVDVGGDPTSHNLWPFELVVAAAVGAFWGFLAGAIGEAVLRLRRRAG